jgi:hypothetical protein
MTVPEAEAQLEEAIRTYAKVMDESCILLTGWVLVGEFMDEDGNPLLASWASRGLPYWRINGMIDAAADAIEYSYEDEDLD